MAVLAHRRGINGTQKPTHLCAEINLTSCAVSIKGGSTSLHYAADYGSLEATSLLLTHRANIEAGDQVRCSNDAS